MSNQEAPKQHFFMFSSGSYSDYGVGGVYVCDHEVTEDEWKAHYGAFQDESARLSKVWFASEGYSRRNYEAPENLSRMAYIKEYDPETMFQRMHNMVAVPVLELWRD
jgi:hypothetical protein